MLPKSVKIGAHVYKVGTGTRKDLGPDISGEMDIDRTTITVLRHASRSRKIEILLHECLHAMLAGHDFSDEEEIIIILGEAVTLFLADNPHFIAESVKVLSTQKKSS